MITNGNKYNSHLATVFRTYHILFSSQATLLSVPYALLDHDQNTTTPNFAALYSGLTVYLPIGQDGYEFDLFSLRLRGSTES